MIMESPVVQQGTQGVSVTTVTSAGSNGSPSTEAPLMHTLQPLAVTTCDNVSQITMTQIPASMHPAFVMASVGEQVMASGPNSQLLMQPPVSVPLIAPSYQMILPTQGLVDQQGGLIKAENSSRANTPSSPAVTTAGSRSATPAAIYQQQQQILQVSDAQNKSDGEVVAASPARQGSTCSGGSPAPPTPSSLGSPLPQMVTADGMAAHTGLHIPIQAGQIPISLQVGSIGLNTQTTVAQTPPPQEEKVNISKLKPPKKPLTPYMRFSKSIWPQVKAANSSMSVCEIGATIGRMWRELADTEKQKYNEDFANDKIRYDTDLQEYLKITGLQASDLIKSRTKKKGSSDKDSKAKNRQAQQSPKTQQQQQQPAAAKQNTVVQQVQGQQLIGVQPVLGTSINGPLPVSMQNNPGVTAAIPQQVLSGAVSGLPHFSQVWTGQQAATIISQGQGTGQEQVIVQQGAGGQQVLINALGLPPGTVVNGSTAGSGENVLSAPILIQPSGEQTAIFSTEGSTDANAEKTESHVEATSVSQATMTQLAALGWQQVMTGNPGDLQQQQHMINLINMAAAQSGVQPDQLTQAAQIAGLQPPGLPIGLQQVNIGTPSTEASTEAQQVEQGTIAQVLSTEASQNGAVPQTMPNGPTVTSGQQAVVTLAQVPSAHSLYNTYGFNPWSGISAGQVVQATDIGGQEVIATSEGNPSATVAATGIQVVYNRENILETELQHLRSALSEKTKEVQRLSQELEKAYSIIEQLKQQNPTAVIQLPAPQPDGAAAGAVVPTAGQQDAGTPPSTAASTTSTTTTAGNGVPASSTTATTAAT